MFTRNIRRFALLELDDLKGEYNDDDKKEDND